MRIAISFNGGKESLVVLHQYMSICKVIFTVEDENDFPEIKEYVKHITRVYNIKLLRFKNMSESIIRLKEKFNINTIILGCRRTDPNCQNLDIVSPTDKNWPFILRFNPLIDWTYGDVWKYIVENNLPICSLYENGYTSIGNKNNTFPNYNLYQNGKFIHAKYLLNWESEREGRIKNIIRSFSGKVIHGKGLGKGLGFPTANLDCKINLDEGVYFGNCFLRNVWYKMVMSVGKNPQFDDVSLEVHILNKFTEDFYDEELTVNVKGFIRKMRKYDNQGLISAINKDIEISLLNL